MLEVLTRALAPVAAVFAPAPPPAAPGRRGWSLLALFVIAGAVLRFWGLGSVGLHAPDEDTMALPALHLAQFGEPLYPSGMPYYRGILQTYLMAASINAFGDSEWSMRLPSALCGVLLIVLAYVVGRRFLQPAWNLAFVAAVAFLPEMIILSQTARMYVFLLACVAAFLALLFAWERSGRMGWLAAAFAVLVLGLQFHLLMIFATPMLLYPGLRHADPRRLLLGAAACVGAFAAYEWMNHWVAGYYLNDEPEQIAALLGVDAGSASVSHRRSPRFAWWVIGLGTVVAATLAWLVARRVSGAAGRAATGVLLFLALGAQWLLNYHVALVLMVAGLVVAARNGLRARAPLAALLVAVLAVAVAHVLWLQAAGIGTRGVIIRTMIGQAAVFSFLHYLPVSLGAFALTAAGAAVALFDVARRRTVPDVWLFVLLAVWLPLFAVGLFDRNPYFRYMSVALLPLLLAAFATVQWLLPRLAGPSRASSRRVVPVAAVVACLAVVNPVEVAQSVKPQYGEYPDHKGAAEYIKSLALGPRDVIVAEDAIMQTYYLGHVDYVLTDVQNAMEFSYVVDDEVREIYSGARTIATGHQLQSLLDAVDRGDLYIVGSGENFVRGRRWQRGTEIDGILAKLEVVWRGRDGRTVVWKVPPGRAG